MEYTFSFYNRSAMQGTGAALSRFLGEQSVPPVLVFVGTDLAIGDSLGPVAGTMAQQMIPRSDCFIYGTLAAPMTAKEMKYMRKFIADTHPKSKVVVIDAAVGEVGDIGLIRVVDRPLAPGKGVNKALGSLGDISVMGIVSEKSVFNYSLMNLTRLGLVYKMAEIIAGGLTEAISSLRLSN